MIVMNAGMGWQSKSFGGAEGDVYRHFDVVGGGWLWQDQTPGHESLLTDTQLGSLETQRFLFICSCIHSFTFSFS